MIRAVFWACGNITRIASKAISAVACSIQTMAVVRTIICACPHRAILASPSFVAVALFVDVALAVPGANGMLIINNSNAKAHLLGAIHSSVSRCARTSTIHACTMVRTLVCARLSRTIMPSPARSTIAGSIVARSLRTRVRKCRLVNGHLHALCRFALVQNLKLGLIHERCNQKGKPELSNQNR